MNSLQLITSGKIWEGLIKAFQERNSTVGGNWTEHIMHESERYGELAKQGKIKIPRQAPLGGRRGP